MLNKIYGRNLFTPWIYWKALRQSVSLPKRYPLTVRTDYKSPLSFLRRVEFHRKLNSNVPLNENTSSKCAENVTLYLWSMKEFLTTHFPPDVSSYSEKINTILQTRSHSIENIWWGCIPVVVGDVKHVFVVCRVSWHYDSILSSRCSQFWQRTAPVLQKEGQSLPKLSVAETSEHL